MNDIKELSEKLRCRYVNFLEDKIELKYYENDCLNEFIMYFPFLDRNYAYINIYVEVVVEIEAGKGKNIYYLSDGKNTIQNFCLMYRNNLKLTEKIKNIIKRQIKINSFDLEYFEKWNAIYAKTTDDKLIETLHKFLQVLIVLNNIKAKDLI